jgi:uncharacterized protein (DUF433 family)
MSTSRQTIVHPHISKNPDVCGGSPVIEETIYDALAYYYDNRVEIEQDVLENAEETVRGTSD